MSRSRIGTLDGLRGIAILLVIAGHVAGNYQPLDDNLRRWLVAFANAGAGVRLFFVLSGYLITHLLLQELAATGTLSLRDFYRRRTLRIFPAFYVYLLALVLLSLLLPLGVTPATFAAAATFTWNYGLVWITPAPEGWWNLGHLWTLALEQQFYLLWPALLALVAPRRALPIAVALLVWCPLARVGTYFLWPSQRGYLGAMFHTGIDVIMVGCVAALLVQRPCWLDRLRKYGTAGASLAVLWLTVASPLAAELRHGFPAVAGYTLDACAAAWLIAWSHYYAPPVVERLLGRGLLPALGLISYSLYLWQQIFLSPTGLLRHGMVLLPVTGSLLAALGSYFLVERVALRWARRVPARSV